MAVKMPVIVVEIGSSSADAGRIVELLHVCA